MNTLPSRSCTLLAIFSRLAREAFSVRSKLSKLGACTGASSTNSFFPASYCRLAFAPAPMLPNLIALELKKIKKIKISCQGTRRVVRSHLPATATLPSDKWLSEATIAVRRRKGNMFSLPAR